MANTDRVNYIDLAKGLGMLTIIWGHIHSGLSNTIVYAFHIPLFFFLSGLVFSPGRYDNFGVFLKRRWKGLLFPYLIFSFVTWLVWAAYSYATHAPVESYWMPLLQTFIAQGSEGYLVHNVPLWFVLCLFSVELIYYFTSKLPTVWNVLLCILMGVVGAWMSVTDFFDFAALPWSIDVALMAIPFYAAGSIVYAQVGHKRLADWVENHKVASVSLFILSAILLYVGAVNNGHVSMGHDSLGNNPIVFYPTAICGVVCFMIMCISLNNTQLVKRGGVKWFGKNSFRAMAIHNPIKGVVVVVIAKLFHSSNSEVITSVPLSIVTFVITLAITVLCMWLISWGLKKLLKRDSILP